MIKDMRQYVFSTWNNIKLEILILWKMMEKQVTIRL